MTRWADVAVIGGGMAGASIAAHLATRRQVVLIERENRCGYHATGRSAATYDPSYGNDAIQKLTRASWGFFRQPGLDGQPYLTKRRALWVADDESRATFEMGIDEMPALTKLDLDAALEFCPLLNRSALRAAAIEEDVYDIDVDMLHQHYLRTLKRAGGVILTDTEVVDVDQRGGGWRINANGVDLRAPIIVNAAGAWVDQVAALVGAKPIGIQPKRRSAALINLQTGIDCAAWPLIVDAEERWYCRPSGGSLMVSPADETPSDPCDAFADEIDIATGIERFEHMINIRVSHIIRSWAGLRSFVADKSPVIGYDPDIQGFFWCAAQGGYGIQTAPAAGQFGADLMFGKKIDPGLLAAGFDPGSVSPKRLQPS